MPLWRHSRLCQRPVGELRRDDGFILEGAELTLGGLSAGACLVSCSWKAALKDGISFAEDLTSDRIPDADLIVTVTDHDDFD